MIQQGTLVRPSVIKRLENTPRLLLVGFPVNSPATNEAMQISTLATPTGMVNGSSKRTNGRVERVREKIQVDITTPINAP
jgi:hypothetical protein